jgi:hypothetical protein
MKRVPLRPLTGTNPPSPDGGVKAADDDTVLKASFNFALVRIARVFGRKAARNQYGAPTSKDPCPQRLEPAMESPEDL